VGRGTVHTQPAPADAASFRAAAQRCLLPPPPCRHHVTACCLAHRCRRLRGRGSACAHCSTQQRCSQSWCSRQQPAKPGSPQPTATGEGCWHGWRCTPGRRLRCWRRSGSCRWAAQGAAGRVQLGGRGWAAGHTCAWRCTPPQSQSLTGPAPHARPGRREGGWAGVCFQGQHPGSTAVARGFARDVQLFDQGQHVRTLGLQLHPYALLHVPLAQGAASGLLAVAETHTVRLGSGKRGGGGGGLGDGRWAAAGPADCRPIAACAAATQLVASQAAGRRRTLCHGCNQRRHDT